MIEAVFILSNRVSDLMLIEQKLGILSNFFISHTYMGHQHKTTFKVRRWKNAHQTLAFDISPFEFEIIMCVHPSSIPRHSDRDE